MTPEARKTIQFSFALTGAVLVVLGTGFRLGPAVGMIVAGVFCLAAAYIPRQRS